MKQSILIVGAGAVGQVYAYYFARAGHDVHFFVKEKYVAEAEQGFTLYDLNKDKKRQHPVQFKNFHCHSDWSSVATQQWQQVWLCISSTGLAQMDLQPMLQAIGDATVVVLQPGPDDIQHVKAVAGDERVVSGMINLLSYHAPLASEVLTQEGTAFWLPPLIPMPIDGERERADKVIKLLKQAKIPASYQPRFDEKVTYVTAFSMVFMAVLENNHWNFNELGKNKTAINLMIAAQQEAFAALSQHYGTKPAVALTCVKTWMLPSLMFASRHVAPVDIEACLESHFSKVRAQTVALLNVYVERAKQYQLKHEALSALLAQMK